MASLNVEQLQEMSKHVEELTTSGRPALDDKIMKMFKKICKQSDDYVKHAYHLIYTQLEKKHAEIRISAVQMMDQLFHRSHCFRELLLADFQLFMELTLEIDPELPLPAPKPAAQTLKNNTVLCIQQWQNKFGMDYKKLSLGYNFLKSCKKVDFSNVEVQSQAQQQRDQERQQRLDAIKRERVNNTAKEMSDTLPEIRDALIQIESLLQLLMPDPEGFNIHGLMSPNPHRSGFRSPDPHSESTHPLAGLGQSSGKPDAKKQEDREVESKRRLSKSGEKGPKVKKSKRSSNSETEDVKHNNDKQAEHVNNLNEANRVRLKSELKDKVYTRDMDSTTSSKKQNKTDEGLESKPVIDKNIKTENVTVKVEKNDKSVKSNEQSKSGEDSDEIDESEEFQEISSSDSEEEYEYDEEDIGMLSQYTRQSQMIRESGIGSQAYSIDIEISPGEVHLVETPDNIDLLRCLKDLGVLVHNKYLTTVQRWLEVFTKMGGDEAKIKKAINIKQALEKVEEKVGQLKVKRMASRRLSSASTSTGHDDEEEDDFEDVPEKEGYEANIPAELREEYEQGSERSTRLPASKDWMPLPQMYGRTAKEEEEDPASYVATVKRLEQKRKADEQVRQKNKVESQGPQSKSPPSSQGPSQSTKHRNQAPKDLLDKAPKVTFGTDLLYWGEKVETPLLVRYDSEHRFWTPKDTDDLVDKNALESTRKRVINFPGKFEPVKWKCRAPMPNGTLCERMDRLKCPFHGKIVARDNIGQPVDPKEKERVRKEDEMKNQEKLAIDDEELQADIKAATGIDLSRKGRGKKGKGKQKKYPNLTDIKKIHSPTMKRLHSKILNKRAVARVSAALDKIDSKKIRDKFGNQFNYQVPQK